MQEDKNRLVQNKRVKRNSEGQFENRFKGIHCSMNDYSFRELDYGVV